MSGKSASYQLVNRIGYVRAYREDHAWLTSLATGSLQQIASTNIKALNQVKNTCGKYKEQVEWF